MKKRGYALPLSLCVAGVTLMLGLSAAQMTNGDLGLANHQYYQERARQAADFGLEYCVSHQVAPGAVVAVPSLSGAHPFDSVTINRYAHGVAGSPMEVPQGFEYWVAEGRASEHAGARPLASARVGALVRYGTSAGTAGAQVRSLFINHPGPVDFQVLDPLAPVGAPQPLGEAVCSTEYDGSIPYFPFPGQSSAVQLGEVGAFGGRFRIPRGVNQDVVSFHSLTTPGIPITQDGGPINVPTFTPPAGLTPLGVAELSSSYSGILPSGRYSLLKIAAGASVSLKGTYQIDRLISMGQGGTFRVANTNNAKVFVSEMEMGPGGLSLTNGNPSAQNFRFTIKAKVRRLGDSPPPVLNFTMLEGGGVALVADGHRISLTSDSSREIRGAFSASALEVKFADPIGFSVRNPTFVYDITGSTSRKPRTGPPGGNGGSGDEPGEEGGDGFYNDPGDPETNPGETDPEDPTSLQRPGVEPMILSRQPL